MNINNFKDGDIVGICPKCHDELIVKTGKFGKFIGCKNFPRCKKTFNYDGFRVNSELVKLNTHDDYETLHKLITTSDDEIIRNRAEQKLIHNHICSCGEKVSCTRVYRTTPDYPHYLKEYHCPKCGHYITTETRNFASFTRMGRIDDNGDDSHITGGYWV